MPSHQDIHVRLGERGEFAELTLEVDADPSDVTVERLSKVAQLAGIAVTATVEKRLQALVATFHEKPRRISKVIATSTNPVHGTNGYLRWTPRFDRVTKPMSKRTRSGGTPAQVNHYAGLHYVDVKVGDHVGTIVEPTPGTDGVDVSGQPINARPGSPCEVRVEPSLQVDEAGRIISQREGTLQFERNVLRVDDVLTVSGCVDFTTGNIKINGSVDVKEHVRAMFSVAATGDVNVGGLIEAANITCNRNFYCRRGMVGKGRGKIDVGGHAEVGYLNNVRAAIEGNLTLHREAIDCELTVNGELRGESATVIGGTLHVGGGCTLRALGSSSGKPTIIRPSGSLRVARMVHQGTTFHLVSQPRGPLTIAVLRQPVQGPVQLVRDADGQWCFSTSGNLTLPLASVANVTRRAA